MKSSPRSRTPSKLSDSVHHQLDMYALAAGAAGVGVLALAQPADAKIVYTKTHEVIAFGRRYKLDLNHDKITDFTFVNSSSCNTASCFQFLSLRAADEGAGRNQNGPMGQRSAGGWKFASALNKGWRVGGGDHFLSGSVIMESFDPFPLGQWFDVTNRYLGLEFKIKGKTHYGWARLTTRGADHTFRASLTGYAYETIPGKAIITGKTKGRDVITVQPASLGRLAQGSAGLASWRRRQSASNTH